MRSVLKETDEHGPLFPEIETDIKYSDIEAKPSDSEDGTQDEDSPALEMTGLWSLTEKWATSSDSCVTLSLQQSGNSLRGFAVTSPVGESPENTWTVSQELSGFIRGDQFELSGTSYEILESKGSLTGWDLDNWRGTVKREGFVEGKLYDEGGDEGSFWGEKITDTPPDNAPSEHPIHE